MVAVPLPLSTKVIPGGSAPDSVMVGAGVPVVVMLKLPYLLAVSEKVEGLVIVGAPAGALVMMRKSGCTAGVPTPLEAVTVTA